MEAQTNRNRGVGYMLALAIMSSGLMMIDQLTNLMIPITVRHFTADARLIAFIIALNRLFGFLVQPWVAWKSDRVHTRFGRRRPFFLLGIPIELFSLLLLGAMPYVFQGEARHGAMAIALLVLMNVLLQAFQDVNMGAQEPLYADTFKFGLLGRASALRGFIAQVFNVSFSYGAMKLSEIQEIYPYLFCAFFLTVSFLIMVFIIREDPRPPDNVRERYNPLKHLGMLRNPDIAKVSVIGALGLMLPAAFWLFTSLFVTRTLGISKGDMGKATALAPIVAFIFSLPVGFLADRIGPRIVMATGYFLMAGVSAAMAFIVHDFRTFLIVMLVNAGAGIIMAVPMSPMVFQYASPKERGSVFGLIQFVRGLAAFVISLIPGQIVQMSSSYDPTPFYQDDFNKPAQVAARLMNPQTPPEQYIAAQIPDDLLKTLGSTEEAAKLRTPLAQALNQVLDDKDFYTEERFSGFDLPEQSRKLLSRDRSEKEQIIFNRSLVQGIFKDEVFPKANYRVSYIVNIIISLIGGIVVLSTRPGQFRQGAEEGSKV